MLSCPKSLHTSARTSIIIITKTCKWTVSEQHLTHIFSISTKMFLCFYLFIYLIVSSPLHRLVSGIDDVCVSNKLGKILKGTIWWILNCNSNF
jgi:energy-coupling factor transporter transmembrane protein EcfT